MFACKKYMEMNVSVGHIAVGVPGHRYYSSLDDRYQPHTLL